MGDAKSRIQITFLLLESTDWGHDYDSLSLSGVYGPRKSWRDHEGMVAGLAGRIEGQCGLRIQPAGGQHGDREKKGRE